MRNPLKERWAAGRPVLNGWLSIANPFSAEIMAAQGYDSLTVDLQHGVVDAQAMVGLLQAMRASGVVPLARVPWLDPAAVMRALDAGCLGVIAPMIDTPEQAAALVSYLRYPPVGTRSFGPTRAAFSVGMPYDGTADDHMLGFAMIETAAGFRNLEAIARTPGLDGLYVGPSDLTIALTGRRYRFGLDREEPEIIEAFQAILRSAKAAGLRTGLHCGSAAYAARAVGWGFDMVTLPGDVQLLASGAAASLAEVRERLGEAAVPAARSAY
ncbi:aldolase/citrate lyase family protein [Lichenihabitans sp. Uapishka_5]|uniref:HpcH/HpaI aldolase family protein n=1 Tax=Lichenihabitans sp. Uapishka_5 TaxID=3037302 RepID=UPI0029E80D7A|nr:aldolase/citrate lyase family protein [Lichenihabitans sp. Uapishka_5]MDX7951669.1 aldolase/citrate lyase family protein [Lichenihabitans sp. Uapishka_5]